MSYSSGVEGGGETHECAMKNHLSPKITTKQQALKHEADFII